MPVQLLAPLKVSVPALLVTFIAPFPEIVPDRVWAAELA